MYIGAWNLSPDDLNQSFEFEYEKGSSAEWLQNKAISKTELNIFVGSSYFYHEVTRLLSQLKRTPRGRVPFQFFREGYLPDDSWDLTSPITLEE